MATVAERNARMDQLISLTQSWSQKRQKELNDRVAQLTSMLKGRGAGQLLNANTTAATGLVVDEINKFLTG